MSECPSFNELVVLYNLYFFHVVQIFRGPADHKNQVIQQFFQPVEARYVRWNPLTWHGAIAMKVDLLSCGELRTEGAILTSPPSYGMNNER